MTVKELIELLQTFPQDLEVLETKYSDFKLMDPSNWSIVEAFGNLRKDGWIQNRNKPLDTWELRMVGEIDPIPKKYLHFRGN